MQTIDERLVVIKMKLLEGHPIVEFDTFMKESNEVVHEVCERCFNITLMSFCGFQFKGTSDEVEDCEADCVVCRDFDYCPVCGINLWE